MLPLYAELLLCAGVIVGRFFSCYGMGCVGLGRGSGKGVSLCCTRVLHARQCAQQALYGVEWCMLRHVARDLSGAMLADALVLVRHHQQLACGARLLHS